MAGLGDILKLFLPFFYVAESFFKNLVDLFVPACFRAQKDVAGEVVLVTGGGNGLGRSMAIQLARLKATTVIWDIDKKGNEETVRLIQEQDSDARIHAYTVDISKAKDVYAAADGVRREVGEVTILVNNAAIGQSRPVWSLSDQLIQRMMEVNALAHFWLFKAFLPSMKANNHGHIVTILSGSVNIYPMKFGAYISSKSAALGLHQATQTDLAFEHRTGIHMTAAFVDYMATNMTIGCLNCGDAPVLPPDEVAAQIIQGVRLNMPIVTPNKLAFLFYVMKNFIPLKIMLMLFRVSGTDKPFLSDGTTDES